MRNIKLLIQYDGTKYSGWQRQKNAITIQDEIELRLSAITNEKINLICSGRTDSGVHAIGQVANFKTTSKIQCTNLFYALNSFLPKDIRIFKCEETSLDFHSRFSALKREYKYIIYNDIVCPPFIKNYVYLQKKKLYADKISLALKLLEGEHDFTSFSSVNDESKNKIRTIHNTKVEQNNKEITILIQANAFLRKMVRMIIGIIIDVNLKNRPITEVIRILNLKSRLHNYFTAPSCGLYLNKVWY